ncbi:MAG: GNAT family protein [Gordonia sp. (in: high G+C Gram-positive bacteria)]
MTGWLGTRPLVGDRVTLRLLTIDDATALGEVVGDRARFRWSGAPVGTSEAAAYIHAADDSRTTRTAFAVIDNTDHRLIGSTSYYDIDAVNLSVSIGYTFYREEYQGTTVNPTAKYLLLQHAFEDCGAVRVVWHTHEDNAQSRAAIAKLGATFEGLLRKHRRFGTGWRTTAQYAMTDDDWVTVKDALRSRCGASGPA